MNSSSGNKVKVAGMIILVTSTVAITFIALDHVASGRGLETYSSATGQEHTWLSLVIFIVVAGISMTAALIARYFQKRRRNKK